MHRKYVYYYFFILGFIILQSYKTNEQQNCAMNNSRKPKQISSQPAVVEFSDLNDNKKNEFLEFLLRNNITFEKTNAKDDGYVVKLAVPKQKFNNKENKSEKSINSAHKMDRSLVKSKSKSKTKNTKNDSNTEGKGQFQKSVLKITTPKKQAIKTNQSTRKISSRNVQLEQSKPALRELKQMSNSSNIKSGKNDNKKRPYEISKSIKTTQFESHNNNYIISAHKTNEGDKNIKVQRQQNVNKSIKDKQIANKQNYILEKQKFILESSKSLSKSPKPANTKKTLDSSKEKIVEVNTQVKKKTQQQKQICDLVSKYLKIFDLKLQGQRPIKWPIAQLLKIIEQIYNDLFVKNTQSISQRGHSHRQFMGHQHAFVKFIKQFFMIRHKGEKSANSNLINMLYSLSCYLQNEKKLSQNKNYVKEIKASQSATNTGIYMQNFEDFLCQVFQFEDLLFYLFIRNIVLNQGQLMNSPKIKIQKQLKPHLFEKQVILGYRQIVKILNCVLGQDADLVQQYKIMILTHINSQNTRRTEQQQIKISVPQFMSIMVEDYRSKRLIMQQSLHLSKENKHKKNSFANCSLTSENYLDQNISKKRNNVAEKIEQQPNVRFNTNENQTDELTFGEETQSNLQKYLQNQISVDQCKQFWENTQETAIFETFSDNSVQVFLCEKLKQKVIQFINILIDNKSEYNSIDNKKGNQNLSAYQQSNFMTMQKNYIIDLFMKKSVNLLGSLVEMNKLKWFQELKVVDPSQDDIDIVEQLQLNYRKLKANPDAQGIGRLCKNLLTIPQITIALEKLVCL